LSDFDFAVNVRDRFNKLNTKLQGKGPSVHELYAEISSFQDKLMLLCCSISFLWTQSISCKSGKMQL